MKNSVRLIAFYLPQYHPIPENDLWWGKGFTDWTNVARAHPLFPGHYQPHVPADLGFYDLRLPEIRDAQATLAGEYGIYGFCYYHYWFHGRRFLERTFAAVLASGKPVFPFCLCWTNDSWSKRWKGQKDILIAQQHSDEDDILFIRALLPAFRDPRYITVEGRPLFIVYNTGTFPDAAKTAAVWRDCVRAAGLPGIYLVRAETHTAYGTHPDPTAMGFDAALEFPPNGIRSRQLKPDDLHWISDSDCSLFDYREVMMHSINRPTPTYKLFRGVMPSWDNTPRRQKGASIFLHSSPELYQRWLAECIRWTRQQHSGDEQMIFINGWNEWAEGCHLEPDLRYGSQFLKATLNALHQYEQPTTFVGNHGGHPNVHVPPDSCDTDLSEQASAMLRNHLSSQVQLRDAYLALQRISSEQQKELSEIKSTLGWRVLSGYWRGVQKVFPEGTRRRRAFDALFSVLKSQGVRG